MIRWIALGAVFLANGCAVMHSTTGGRPAAVRASSTFRSASQPVLPPMQSSHGEALDAPLELPQAIEIALANNPQVGEAAWEVAAAQARRDQASGERLPRLTVAGGYAHHLDEQRLLPVRQPGDPAVLSRDIVSGDLLLSLPLFTGGRLINQVRAADLLLQAASHELARSRDELVFNVSSLFFGILAQDHLVESLEFSRGALGEHLRRVDGLIVAQKAAKVDRLRTEVRLADVEQQLVRERNISSIQRRALGGLLGLADQAGALTLRGVLAAPPAELLPDLEGILAAALSRRPDYLAARAVLEAQARNVGAARAAHWPAILLQGAYGGRWAVGGWTGSGKELDDVGRIALTLELPLFEGGRTSARIRERLADLNSARERLRRVELQVRLEVETALLNVTSARQRAAAIEKAIEQARESLRIEQQRYELGRGAIIDVLDAQAALLESQTNFYHVLAELHTALARLRLATGEP